MKTCPDCNGDGVIERGTDDERQCPTCGGSGFVPDDDGHEEVIKTSPLERESGTVRCVGRRSQADRRGRALKRRDAKDCYLCTNYSLGRLGRRPVGKGD